MLRKITLLLTSFSTLKIGTVKVFFSIRRFSLGDVHVRSTFSSLTSSLLQRYYTWWVSLSWALCALERSLLEIDLGADSCSNTQMYTLCAYVSHAPAPLPVSIFFLLQAYTTHSTIFQTWPGQFPLEYVLPKPINLQFPYTIFCTIKLLLSWQFLSLPNHILFHFILIVKEKKLFSLCHRFFRGNL